MLLLMLLLLQMLLSWGLVYPRHSAAAVTAAAIAVTAVIPRVTATGAGETAVTAMDQHRQHQHHLQLRLPVSATSCHLSNRHQSPGPLQQQQLGRAAGR